MSAISPQPISKEKNVPKPRAIQPCLSITDSPPAFQTEVAHTAVIISMMIKAAKTMIWPMPRRFMVCPPCPRDERATKKTVPCIKGRPAHLQLAFMIYRKVTKKLGEHSAPSEG